MEIAFNHKTKGFIREVNVAYLEVVGRVIMYYCPDKEKHYVQPLAEITDLEIEDGILEKTGLYVPEVKA